MHLRSHWAYFKLMVSNWRIIDFGYSTVNQMVGYKLGNINDLLCVAHCSLSQ